MTDNTKLVVDFITKEAAENELIKIRDRLLGFDEKKGIFKKRDRKDLPEILYYGKPTSSAVSLLPGRDSTIESKAYERFIHMPNTAKVVVVDSPKSDVTVLNPIHTETTTKSSQAQPHIIENKSTSTVNPAYLKWADEVTPGKVYGFMHIRCEHCGNIGSFFIKPERATEENICPHCKGVTPLTGLRKLVAECKCGKRWIYKTNLRPEDAPFDKPCLECSSPMSIKYNANTDSFDTMK
jgi:ribosomal protein S27E